MSGSFLPSLGRRTTTVYSGRWSQHCYEIKYFENRKALFLASSTRYSLFAFQTLSSAALMPSLSATVSPNLRRSRQRACPTRISCASPLSIVGPCGRISALLLVSSGPSVQAADHAVCHRVILCENHLGDEQHPETRFRVRRFAILDRSPHKSPHSREKDAKLGNALSLHRRVVNRAGLEPATR